jgi:hypothetical protein
MVLEKGAFKRGRGDKNPSPVSLFQREKLKDMEFKRGLKTPSFFIPPSLNPKGRGKQGDRLQLWEAGGERGWIPDQVGNDGALRPFDRLRVSGELRLPRLLTTVGMARNDGRHSFLSGRRGGLPGGPGGCSM